MQDPHHQGGHGHQHHDHKPHHHHGHEPHDADREAEGEDRPHTPSYLRPPVAGRSQSDSGSDPSLPQSRCVEFDLSSPVRPKSPWGRFDPYNNNEVTLGGPVRKPRGDKQDLRGLVLLSRRCCFVMCWTVHPQTERMSQSCAKLCKSLKLLCCFMWWEKKKVDLCLKSSSGTS